MLAASPNWTSSGHIRGCDDGPTQDDGLRFLGGPEDQGNRPDDVGGVDPEGVVFTRNCTEAINLVAHAWGRANIGRADAIVLTGKAAISSPRSGYGPGLLAAMVALVATTLVLSAPIGLTALSGPLFGERVGPWRWGAVAAGFVGVAHVVVGDGIDSGLESAHESLPGQAITPAATFQE